MYFMLTRPKEDSDRLAKTLTSLGHQVFCEPLLEIKLHEDQEIDLANFQAILFTSSNGVRAFVKNRPETAEPEIACFAVGKSTADMARKAGFQRVFTAGGNGEKLAELVIEKCDPHRERLLHISGTDVTADLSVLLRKAGFSVTRMPLYQARKISRLSPEGRALIASGKITHMPFYSPRTAGVFCDLVTADDLPLNLTKITALCLSPAIYIVINSLNWHDILVATQPGQHELFNLIDITLEEGTP